LKSTYDERVRLRLVDLVDQVELEELALKSKHYDGPAFEKYQAAVEAEYDAYFKQLIASGDGNFAPLSSAPPDVAYVDPMWWCPRCRIGLGYPMDTDSCVFDILNNQGTEITTGLATKSCRICSFDPVNVPEPIQRILNAERFKLPVVRGHRSGKPCPVVPWNMRKLVRRKPSQHFAAFAKMTHAAGKILEHGKH
jgi:hypothetical protein